MPSLRLPEACWVEPKPASPLTLCHPSLLVPPRTLATTGSSCHSLSRCTASLPHIRQGPCLLFPADPSGLRTMQAHSRGSIKA